MAVYRYWPRLRTVPAASLRRAAALGRCTASAEVALGVLTSISIDVDARIEPGFYVGHFVSLRIGPGVRIGRNCSVGQDVHHRRDRPRTPRPKPRRCSGERVYLGSGAKVSDRCGSPTAPPSAPTPVSPST